MEWAPAKKGTLGMGSRKKRVPSEGAPAGRGSPKKYPRKGLPQNYVSHFERKGEPMNEYVAVCLLCLVVACGRGSGGVDSDAKSSCLPTCLRSFAMDCVPDGACVHQTNATTGITNLCWDNGVSEILNSKANPMITVSKGGSTCYSMSFITSGALWSVSDPSGSVLATFTPASGTDSYLVTCSGGQPQTVDATCASTSPVLGISAASSGNNCTAAGTCGS